MMTERERKREGEIVRDGGGEKLLSRRNVMAILERRLQNCGPRLNIRCHVNESLSTAGRFAYGADNVSTFFETNYGAVIARYDP